MSADFEPKYSPDFSPVEDDLTAESDVLNAPVDALYRSPDVPYETHPQPYEQERESVTLDEEGEQMHVYNVDTERHLLEQEVLEKVVNSALVEFSHLLSGRDDYVIFASTALYLQAREHYGRMDEKRKSEMSNLDKAAFERFSKTPGDLDISVNDRASMLEIYRRLSRHEGVRFDEPEAEEEMDGPMFVSKLDGARILRGSMRVEVDGQSFDYPFELFTDSFVVPKGKEYVEKKGDLRVLNLTGLKKQYARNFEVEQRLRVNIERVERFLNDHEYNMRAFLNTLDDLIHPMEEILSGGAASEALQEQLGMTDDDLRDYYKTKADLLAANGDAKKEKEARAKIETLIGGMKTKLQKRIDDIQAIEQLQRDGV
ncbi:MAG: hypothetical protein O3B64_02905 [bacterium]|nr:hypothetical protein [bacterium]MDA1024389.1 hypothetical protein [bacterium]